MAHHDYDRLIRPMTGLAQINGGSRRIIFSQMSKSF